jgi:hypothetical protein
LIQRLVGAAFLVLALAGPAAAAEFRAAAVKIDITPETPQWLLGYGPRQSKSVRDKLYHRIAVMNDGTTTLVIAASDLGAISPAFFDEFCVQLEKETGIGRRQLLWTVTHTHSAPEVGPPGLAKVFLGKRYNHEWDRTYTDLVKKSLIDGVRDGIAKLAPARFAVGTGMSMANINRRAKDVDGRASLGLNPEGPVDRRIALIRLERPDGSPIALIASYAMHGTVIGEQPEVSADAPGAVAEYVEEKVGAPMLYVNGAAGDVGPIYTLSNFRNLPRFKVLLGNRILAANRSIRADATEQPVFEIGEEFVESACKPGIEWPADLADYSRIDSAGVRVVRFPVRFLRLRRDTVLWSAPLELFCEIEMRVRSQSPFTNTFYFGYANGWLGYLPTAEAFESGGYEPGVSPFTARAEEDLASAVIRHLQGMPR